MKLDATEMLVPTKLKTKDGQCVFLLYKIVPTKKGFDFFLECACLEDKTPLELAPNTLS